MVPTKFSRHKSKKLCFSIIMIGLIFTIACNTEHTQLELTSTYCIDETVEATQLSEAHILRLRDNNRDAVAVEDNIATIAVTPSDSRAEGYLRSTITFTESGLATPTTFTLFGDCIDISCYALSGGTLDSVHFSSFSTGANEEGEYDIEQYISIDYQNPDGHARSLQGAVDFITLSLSSESNDYTCSFSCAKTEKYWVLTVEECGDIYYECDYTCSTGTSGHFKTNNTSCNESPLEATIASGTRPGGDCVAEVTYPELPADFSLELAP